MSSKITNIVKKAISVTIIGCTVVSLTACSDTTWVYKFDGKQVNSGLYIAQTMSAFSEASSHKDLNPDVDDLMKQNLDGKPAKTWITDKARESAADYIAVELKFDELGLALSETDNAIIDQSVKTSWDAVSSFYEKNGVNEATYRSMNVSQQKREKIFEKYYGVGGIKEVPEADITKYFKENYVSVNLLGLKLEVGETLTDEQKATNEATKKSADELLKMMNVDKKTFNEVKAYYNELENEGKAEADKIKIEILDDKDTVTLFSKKATSPSAEVIASLFDDTKIDGDAVLLSDENGYYLCKRYDVMASDKSFEDNRLSLLGEMKSVEYNEMFKEWSAEISPKLTVNEASIKRYAPKNIDFSY